MPNFHVLKNCHVLIERSHTEKKMLKDRKLSEKLKLVIIRLYFLFFSTKAYAVVMQENRLIFSVNTHNKC